MAFPYNPGQRLTIRPHDPPEPIKRRSIGREGLTKIQSKSPLERCLLYPPLEGGLTGTTTVSLTILESVRVGDGHRSQVVIVEASSDSNEISTYNNEVSTDNNEIPGGIRLIAKFYDP